MCDKCKVCKKDNKDDTKQVAEKPSGDVSVIVKSK
jgi:hypothetical protein